MRAHTHTHYTYSHAHTQTHTHRHTHTDTHRHTHTDRHTHTQTQTHTHRQTVIYIYLHLFTPAETYCEMYTDAYMCILHNDVDFAHAHINTIKHTHTFCMRVQFTSCQYMGCVHEPEPWACRIHMVGLQRGWIEEQHHRSLWDLLSRGRAGPHAGDSEFEDHRALQGEIRLAANISFLSLKMFEVFVLKLSSWDGLILIIFEGFSMLFRWTSGPFRWSQERHKDWLASRGTHEACGILLEPPIPTYSRRSKLCIYVCKNGDIHK